MKGMNRFLGAALAPSLCLLLAIYGFAQEPSDEVKNLIKQLHLPNAEARKDAARTLGRMRAFWAYTVPVLVEILKDDADPRLRGVVAASLGQMGTAAKDAVPALIEALKKDPDSGVRLTIANSLVRMSAASKDVVPALIEALRKDTELGVRNNAAASLADIGPEAKDAAPALIEALRKDAAPQVRASAATALGDIKAESTDLVPALIQALEEDVDPTVRINAAEALWRIGAEPKDAASILIKIPKAYADPNVRYRAVEVLAQIGAQARDAVPGLIEILKKDIDPYVRLRAAEALGQVGADLKDVAPALIDAVRKDAASEVRMNAASALGQLGAEARDVVPALIEALREDADPRVRVSAAMALGQIGPEAKDAVAALIEALKGDYNGIVVQALGQIGAEAKYAVPALIEVLKKEDDHWVRGTTAVALAQISHGLYDARATETLPELKVAYAILKDHQDRGVRGQAVEVKRTIDYFESLWWVGLREKTWLWITDHSTISGIIGAYLILLVFWSLVFWLRPLWLLPVSAFLSRYEPKIKTQNMEIGLPLRHLLLVSLFHYRKRVLDRWVQKHLATARENFANRRTVKERKTYVSTPTMTNEEICDGLSPALLHLIFDKPKSTVLISGEGGAGKTSLACQMALWAMDDESENRLCKSHRMLPVLIEGNLEPKADGKNAFIESIRGHLRELIGVPDEIPEEFLLQLLRKRRVLVIVDSLSELDEATRHNVKPAQPDFAVAAFIVTARIDDVLGGAAKTTIKPLRLNKDRLSFFMDRYLEQRGKQFETDEELFESCRNLSQLIGERDITALIAKMYAELKIASKEQPSNLDLPRNLPDLMQGYAGNINESVKAGRKDTRAVLCASKAVAWECLKETCRPAPAKRDDVLKALRREADAEAMLVYLEERLQLIQTTGAGKDAVRFSLDPLAEYLASLHIVEHCNNSISRWQEITDLLKAQLGAPEIIKGFLLALEDCFNHHGQQHGVPGFAIEAINQLLKPVPTTVAAAD